MTSMTSLAPILQTLFSETADALAQETGFMCRRRKLTGSSFACTLVFSWLAHPAASLGQLCQQAVAGGQRVSRQALDQRFSESAATFLARLLAAALATLVSETVPVAAALLQRFPAVVVLDSTVISLPAALAAWWPGCGGRTPGAGAAALKVGYRYDLLHGVADVLEWVAGRVSDQCLAIQHAALPAGTLRLSDLGFFSLRHLQALLAQQVQFLCRPKAHCLVRIGLGPLEHAPLPQPLRLVLEQRCQQTLDLPIWLGGGRNAVSCRLLAVRVPPQIAAVRYQRLSEAARREGMSVSLSQRALTHFTVLVTSLSAAELSLSEALVLYRARWQVELVFKLWKQAGLVDEWRTHQPWRILCEVYAKLLALLVQHWLTLLSAWDLPDKSLVQAAQVVRDQARNLGVALVRRPSRLPGILGDLRRVIRGACRIAPRKQRPALWQLLADPSLGWAYVDAYGAGPSRPIGINVSS
ncbi:MAG: IS4 family transposase [Actinomycetota bacterium]|nr:IS4 family transposase [Actinomycetota bacterium]